jgi:hypothetical protein
MFKVNVGISIDGTAIGVGVAIVRSVAVIVLYLGNGIIDN